MLENPETTYNFEVADFHTYYVGSTEVLVHNKCRGKNKLRPDSNATGSHTVFKRNSSGEIVGYATYEPNSKNPSGFDEVFRFDKYGKHGKVIGSHVHLQNGEVRPAYFWEIPK